MARTKRKDGRMEKKITINGKQYHIYGKTASEIAEKEMQKREEIRRGLTNRNNPTMREYSDKWLERVKDSVKNATYHQYATEIRVISRTKTGNIKFGDIRIKDININDIRSLQETLSDSHVSTYVNSVTALIKRILQDATNERMIEHNPCVLLKSLKRTEERANETYHRALTKTETKLFFECETTKNSAYYNVFRLALNTGMRIGEIGALRSSDIHDNNINIVRTISKSETNSRAIGDDTKTSSGKRSIPLNDRIREIISDQKKINAMLDRNTVIDINDSKHGLLFKTPRNNILDIRTINGEIAKICNQVGIEKFTMHAFRDTFSTRAIESGIQPKTLQVILGHSNIAITLNLYTHVMDETKQEAMEMIDIAI